MIKITLYNSDGMLDVCEVRNSKNAAEAALGMIDQARGLYPGDRIEVTGEDEEEEEE